MGRGPRRGHGRGERRNHRPARRDPGPAGSGPYHQGLARVPMGIDHGSECGSTAGRRGALRRAIWAAVTPPAFGDTPLPLVVPSTEDAEGEGYPGAACTV